MRCKSGRHLSAKNQSQASSLSDILTRFQPSVAKQTQIATLCLSLGLGTGYWFVSEAIVPQIVRAYTARVNLTLDRQFDETYETLLRRAEAAGRAAAQRSFDRDILVTDVAVTVLAQNQGSIAPVLSLQVSRPQWSRRPDAQRWATYFPNAQLLLGFGEIASTTPGQSRTTYPTTNRTRNPYRTFQPGTTTPTGTTGQTRGTSIVIPGQPTNGIPTRGGTGAGSVVPTPQTPTPGTGVAPIPATSAPVPSPVGPLQTPSTPTNSTPTNSAIPIPPAGTQSLPPIVGGTTVNQSAPTTNGVPGIAPFPTQNQIAR